MATYVNDLRLKEITTGDESGTWGTSTNTNLELIANAMGLGAEAIPNASTHTITMADGAADEFRSTFLRLTGGGQACTVTLGPSTLSHTWIMRNETAAALTLTQGSGANVVIAAGQTKIVSTDGGGAGAIVYEMDDLELAGNLIASAATITTLASSAATLTGGTVNGMVVGGSTPAAGTFTTLTANTSATVSGDLTVDTSTLKVDSTNNRVGILNASPDVVLDIGSSTDAVHMPVGTTGQRPTGAAGYFRYNSTLSQFEGYTDGWGAIGGGGGSNLVSNTMTGDGSTTTISLTNNPQDENNTQVYIDGVYQNKDTYSVSGTTLTFSTAPPLGTAVEVMTIEPTAINIPADGSVTPAKIASGDFYFDTNTLYVDATNNRVGIGTSSPVSALDLSGGADGTIGVLTLAQGNGTSKVAKVYGTSTNTNEKGIRLNTYHYADIDAVTITSDGKVGIGTSSPSSYNSAGDDLVIASAGAGLTLASDASDSGHILFADRTSGTGAYAGFIRYDHTTDSMRFAAGAGVERLRIDGTTGSVGIGTSSPSAKLEVAGSSNSTYLKVGGDDSSNGRALTFTSSASAAFNGAVHTINAPSSQGVIALATASTERMRIASNGSISIPNQNAINELTFTGTEFTNVVSATTSGFQFGTTGSGYLAFLTNNSEKARILPTGGITFNGDTAQANALDDYEEGTFNATATGTGTLSVVNEKYTKIGNVVTVFFQVNFSGASGGLSISGLPFTSTSLTNSVGIGREDATSGYAVYGRLSSASTVIAMYYTGATGNATPFQVAAGNFAFSITYFTDS